MSLSDTLEFFAKCALLCGLLLGVPYAYYLGYQSVDRTNEQQDRQLSALERKAARAQAEISELRLECKP
jgi:hypothetical protein